MSWHIPQKLLFTKSLTITNLTVSSVLLVSCDNHQSHHTAPCKHILVYSNSKWLHCRSSQQYYMWEWSNHIHSHMNTEMYTWFSHQALGNFLTEFHSLLVNQQHTPCCTPIQLQSASLHILLHSTEDMKTTKVNALVTEHGNRYLVGRCLCYEFSFLTVWTCIYFMLYFWLWTVTVISRSVRHN